VLTNLSHSIDCGLTHLFLSRTSHARLCTPVELGHAWVHTSEVKPNTHRRRRRDETVLSRRVGVGGVYMNSQLAYDDYRRIR